MRSALLHFHAYYFYMSRIYTTYNHENFDRAATLCKAHILVHKSAVHGFKARTASETMSVRHKKIMMSPAVTSIFH